MHAEIEAGQKLAHKHDTLVVRVRYITVRKPFLDSDASVNETLSALKVRALAFFGLAEGPVEGGNKTYYLAMDGVELTNLSATLGSISQGKHELKLDLIERFEQG